MSSMVTLIAQAPCPDGGFYTATLTLSSGSYDDRPEDACNLVKSWLVEDHPRVHSGTIEVVVHRG